MILSWNVDVGTCYRDGQTLSNISYFDYDKKYSIYATPESNTHINIDSESFGSYDAGYYYLEDIFGKTSLAALYGPPTSVPSDARGKVAFLGTTSYFPQIQFMYPNLYEHILNTTDAPFVLIHFKTSDKYLVLCDRNGSFVYAGSYGSDLQRINYIDSGMLYLNNVTAQSAEGRSISVFCFAVAYEYDGGIVDTSKISHIGMRFNPGSGVLDSPTSVVDFGGRRTSALNSIWNDIIGTSPPDNIYSPPVNPYEPGGDSGEGGGDGTFDDESDPIDIPPLPTLSSANTGFTRIYNPTLSQVQDLAQYLWTDESIIQTLWNHIKQFFENPMEAIIGFNLVPVPVPDAGTKNFALMFIDTGVSMNVAANQFVDVDCGTVKLDLYYGSAMDYSPYTKVSCFLPYIGTVSLDVDEVMGRTLGVKYRVDICSGSCVAYVTVDGNAIYQYSGHCAIQIPISAGDFTSYVSAIMAVAKLGGTAALGAAGVGASATVLNASQHTNQTTTRTTQSQSGDIRTVVNNVDTQRDRTSTEASFAGLSPQNVANTVGQVMSSKMHIEHSGSFSGNSGYLGVRRPFLIIKRPNMCMPSNYQSLNGFPSMITLKLGDCTGFTRVQQVQLTGLTATNPEQAEILSLLKSGVVL